MRAPIGQEVRLKIEHFDFRILESKHDYFGVVSDKRTNFAAMDGFESRVSRVKCW